MFRIRDALQAFGITIQEVIPQGAILFDVTKPTFAPPKEVLIILV